MIKTDCPLPLILEFDIWFSPTKILIFLTPMMSFWAAFYLFKSKFLGPFQHPPDVLPTTLPKNPWFEKYIKYKIFSTPMCFLVSNDIIHNNLNPQPLSASYCSKRKIFNEKIPFNILNEIWIQQLNWIKIQLNCIQIQLKTNGMKIVEECI
jgi:hypothetical protein